MAKLSDPEDKKKLSARLAKVEGQLRGLQSMIEREADCEKIAQQLSASRKALDKAFFAMMGCMIEQGNPPTKRVTEMLTKLS
jgi:CsoR family transcriptional regulator, copper-sensing transcriptional repressor